MEDQEDRAPRLRDLGDARQPFAGVPELGKVGDVGDVGELPYAVDEEGDDQVERNPRALLIGLAVVLLVAIAIVVALVV